jgi:hypothetical protein
MSAQTAFGVCCSASSCSGAGAVRRQQLQLLDLPLQVQQDWMR